MTRRGVQFATEVAALAIGIGLVYLAPEVALTVIVIAVPVVLTGAAVSIAYLRHVYRLQPVPRSRFFGMLVSVSARATLIGSWIGYLVVGRIGERTGWFVIPTPPPAVSSPISGLVVVVFIAPPIVYAFAVWRVRRAATLAAGEARAHGTIETTAAEDERQLDRGSPAGVPSPRHDPSQE